MNWRLALGGSPDYRGRPRIDTGSGVAFQVNYGRRLIERRLFALYGEINFVASPLRDVSGSVGIATGDFASLDITPGVRVKFRPSARFAPFAAVGGSYVPSIAPGGQHNIVSAGAIVLPWN